MPAIALSVPAPRMENYLVVGDPNDRRPSFWTSRADRVEAQYTALAWAVCGWATRVLDLGLAEAPGTPALLDYFPDLAAVTAVAPGVTAVSRKAAPVADIPWPCTPEEFFAWLGDLSRTPPTFTP